MKATLSLLTALLLAPLAALHAAYAPKQTPNVIVILADDLGWADLSCYGSTFHESPNLDKLAAEGMRFTQAYSSSPYCSPSRAAIMTGRHPARLKITDYIPSNGKGGKLLPAVMKMELPLEEVTIAEVLRDAGYATWHVGKWHLGALGFYPEDQGFQVNIAGNHSGAPSSFFWPNGDKDGVTVVRPAARDQMKGYHATPVPGLRAGGKASEHLCDRLTREAIKFIEQHKQEQPFFLYLPFYDVHTPIMAKAELIDKYTAKAAKQVLAPSSTASQTWQERAAAHALSAEHNKKHAIMPKDIKMKPYEIPLRALIAKDVDGLMMAGRCISGDFIAHSSYRVTGNAVAMGEAVGVVAALAAASKRLPHEVPWSEATTKLITIGHRA